LGRSIQRDLHRTFIPEYQYRQQTICLLEKDTEAVEIASLMAKPGDGYPGMIFLSLHTRRPT
jgi:hypothetical protein